MSATATQPQPKTTSLAKPSDGDGKIMSYVPFGASDQIKLSVKIVQDMICVPATNGKVCSEVEAFKFMMLCQARKLNPFEGDCFLLGYASDDGKSATFSLITAHQAFLKRAEMHPEFDGMESGVMVRDAAGNVVDREGDFVFEEDFILGGWAVVHFKTRKYPMRKRAKLLTYTTGKSRWKKDPCGMIVKVAEADALRSSFPTMLGGLYTEGESPLQFVNEAPKAPEIPKGRTKLKDLQPAKTNGNGHPPEQEQLDTASGEVANEADRGDASEEPSDTAAMDCQDTIRDAENPEQLLAAEVKLKANKDRIGGAEYIALVRYHRERVGEMAAGAKK